MDQSELKQLQGEKLARARRENACEQVTIGFGLIDWESGASFFNQWEREAKQNQSKHNVTFDTQLKLLYTE